MLKCPFCNNYDLVTVETGIGYAIKCVECGAEGPDQKDKTIAIMDWNIPTEYMEGLEAENKRLKQELETARDLINLIVELDKKEK